MPRQLYAKWTCPKCQRQAIALPLPNETSESLTKRFEKAHAAEGCGGFMPPKTKPQCQFAEDSHDKPRCQKTATTKWGGFWFCKEHGDRKANR